MNISVRVYGFGDFLRTLFFFSQGLIYLPVIVLSRLKYRLQHSYRTTMPEASSSSIQHSLPWISKESERWKTRFCWWLLANVLCRVASLNAIDFHVILISKARSIKRLYRNNGEKNKAWKKKVDNFHSSCDITVFDGQ